MKKLACLLFILLALTFSSCLRQGYGILSYQEKEIYAECLLNGEYKIAVTKSNGEKTVSFLSPSSLSSISFTEKDGKIIGRTSDIEIPLEKENLGGISAILSIFSLDEESLVSAVGDKSSACMEFSNDLGTYKITMGKNDLPKRIEILSPKYEFDIVIDAIKLN